MTIFMGRTRQPRYTKEQAEEAIVRARELTAYHLRRRAAECSRLRRSRSAMAQQHAAEAIDRHTDDAEALALLAAILEDVLAQAAR